MYIVSSYFKDQKGSIDFKVAEMSLTDPTPHLMKEHPNILIGTSTGFIYRQELFTPPFMIGIKPNRSTTGLILNVPLDFPYLKELADRYVIYGINQMKDHFEFIILDVHWRIEPRTICYLVEQI